MKLYAEEQVRKMLEVCRDSDLYEHILTWEDILRTEKPIELPSDEDVQNEVKNLNKEVVKNLIKHLESFEVGAIWSIKILRDKIQGGNK